MIEADPNAARYAETGVWGRATLDALFKRNVARAPDRLALVDAGDKAAWAGSEPLRLTYRQADAAVSALAGRFAELGLRPGGVVGIQMPNSAEAALTVLAAHRAGLVPALMPFLWRSRDVVRALEPLTPKALATVVRAGDETPADGLRYAAAELFSIRFVMAFGHPCPDGVMALADCLDPVAQREPRLAAPSANPGDEAALVTFRATADGAAPVARSHNHCIAAGLATVLEARMEPGDTVLSAMLPSSLGVVAAAFVPWLLTGGALALAQPFDGGRFTALATATRAAHAVVPGGLLDELEPVLAPLAGRPLKSILAVLSDGRRLATRSQATFDAEVVDLANLDEWGILALRREDGAPRLAALGPLRQPSTGANGPVLVETRLASSGRLSVRGPMVPWDPIAEGGYRTTGLTASEAGGLVPMARRADGVAFVGGLGVGTAEVEALVVGAAEVDAVDVVAIPDPIFGERIEARVAPRLSAPVGDEALARRIGDKLAALDLAPYKVPSRIVVDHKVRAMEGARLRTAAVA
jgi:non-ribosomal peptide synthetase component E (peptide arylation enzyme)